jgi:peptidoglycan/xylan/chitin deacetylase (PgdA/CDA1 family)
MVRAPNSPRVGTFVISLDFELQWGPGYRLPPDGGPYRENLLNTRAAIAGMLDLFDRFDVAATWATVGCLFARNRDELEGAWPDRRPSYVDERLSSYGLAVGDDEQTDPLHFAPSVIDQISTHSRQEIASHTFSHYYCDAPGQTLEQFRADLDAAVRIATERGLTLRSLVFPKNQVRGDYLACLPEYGFLTYRGRQSGWMSVSNRTGSGSDLFRRAGRLADSYVPLMTGPRLDRDALRVDCGLVNIPASRFLRPYSRRLRHFERVRLDRIMRELRMAARNQSTYHLWWHPHNFGANLDENLRFLEAILDCFRECSYHYGMRSATMADLATEVLNGWQAPSAKAVPDEASERASVNPTVTGQNGH